MRHHHAVPRFLPRCRGVSLIELMVSLTVGLMVILAIGAVVTTSSANTKSNERTAELQLNGRTALEILKRDLMHAGYRGLTWSEPTAGALGTITKECAAGFVANLRQGMWGSDDSNPFGATCLPSYQRGDVLVIRRLSLDPVSSLAPDTIYFRSAYERGQTFKGGAAPVFTETPNQDFRVEVIVYFVGPYSFSPTENPQVPGLWRVTLQPGPTMATAELVAPGIENLQIQYGRYTTDGNTRYYDAGAVSSAATSTTTDPNEWDDVHSVRMFLLARNLTPEPGYSNSNTYAVGNRNVTVNDSTRRQVFSSVIQVRNN